MPIAYCPHCKSEEEISFPKEGRTLSGHKMIHGVCPHCSEELMLVEEEK